MRKLKTLLALLMIFILTGCATIIHGRKQDIRVVSSPSGAVVRVNGISTTTPGILTLDRNRAWHTLIFEKEGYEPVEVELRRTIDGWWFGNILLGGIVGMVIDFATGSAYNITPSDIDVVLHEKAAHLLKDKKDAILFVDKEYLENKKHQETAKPVVKVTPQKAPEKSPEQSWKILTVQTKYQFVIISAREAGLEIGATYDAYDGESVVGQVKVRKLDKLLAVADIISEVRPGAVKEGNTVQRATPLEGNER